LARQHRRPSVGLMFYAFSEGIIMVTSLVVFVIGISLLGVGGALGCIHKEDTLYNGTNITTVMPPFPSHGTCAGSCDDFSDSFSCATLEGRWGRDCSGCRCNNDDDANGNGDDVQPIVFPSCKAPATARACNAKRFPLHGLAAGGFSMFALGLIGALTLVLLANLEVTRRYAHNSAVGHRYSLLAACRFSSTSTTRCWMHSSERQG
jgi:hypothetical protein